MKRVLYSVVGALVVAALMPSPAQAQDTKSVSGTITAIGASSITVKVNDKDMTFNVDAKTDITTPGGSTKTRAARAEGAPGPKIADLLKVGQGVEVRYHEAGMHAASIRTLAAPPKAGTAGTTAPPPPPALTMRGTVSAVTGSSLTVKGSAGEMTFVIDEKTDVTGTGASTATRQKKAAGEKTVITDFVGNGDNVNVSYREVDGTKHATHVRVTRKGRG